MAGKRSYGQIPSLEVWSYFFCWTFAGNTDAMSPEEQQDTWLNEGKAVVKQQAFLMKRALDNSNLKDALRFSSNMLCELRTGLLSPKNYYELYMMVGRKV